MKRGHFRFKLTIHNLVQSSILSKPSFAVALLLGVSCGHAFSATFQWGNTVGNWSVPANWEGAVAPSGTSPADGIVFAGDVGTTLGVAPNYTTTNDTAAVPFSLNSITLNATDAAALVTDPANIIAGNTLAFGGVSPQLIQNGAGAFTFTAPIVVPASLRLGGNGVGSVTFNRKLSGFGTIIKEGTSVFRFGTFPPPIVPPATTSSAPSENTWFGPLQINAGIIRFNNNADSGRTALRANPVSLSTGAALTCSSELRLGTLSGNGGMVESQVAGTNTNTEDIVVSAFSSGTFAGTIRLGLPTGTGNDLGALVVRGPGTQTLTGTLNLSKDVAVGGSLTFDGAASLSAQTTGAIVMGGGTFRLENVTTNNNNRLRDGSDASTGLDNIGGGLFQLSGNAGGTTETLGRLQLSSTNGTINRGRSGQLNVQVVHRAGAGAATVLTIAGYQRDASFARALNTVEFSAIDDVGTMLNLGTAGNNPRVMLATTPTLASSLLSSFGWATVQKTDGVAFATHGANGIAAVATTALVPGTTDSTVNSQLTTSATITPANYAQNSIRILPASSGLTMTLGAAATLTTTAIALAGPNDFTITGGTLGGGGPRFINVEKAKLTLASGVGSTQPLVKSGNGILALTKTTNVTGTQPCAINSGTLYATPGTTLPNGELRFRGGVLGIIGGGTFARPFLISNAPGPGTVNWSGLEYVATPTPTSNTLPEDRGSGGFAAIDADASVDLGVAGVSDVLWEQKGFVQSGFALVLGSAQAAARITFIDNLSLSSGESNINYNAREIRVPDNAASTLDRAVLSGVLTGTTHNDFLKTGAGTLELTAVNTFLGAAIIHAGTLVVTGSATSAIGLDVMTGATLAGSGSTTAVLLEGGGQISPGDSSIATLTVAALSWRAGGIARLELGAANTSDRINLGNGALVKDSASGTFAVDFANTGAMNQTYTLATFGSTTFSASDFTATNLAAGVTGRFIITPTSLIYSTVPSTPMSTWRETHFGIGATNSGTAADNADPDADSLQNLAEYVLGGSPLLPTRTTTPAYSLGTLTFTRNLAATDVTLRIEARNSLATGTWQTIATRAIGAGAWSTTGGVSVVENGSAVTVTDTATPATQSQRFLRLAIDHP